MKPVLGVVRVVALSAFCVLLAWTARAPAATVAILSASSPPGLSEVAFRLRGELSALRFEVLLLRRPGTADARAWLEDLAEARGIDAAVEVVGEAPTEAVDVWIFQRSPRRSQVARVVVEPDTPDRAGALAIRAIEVLRSYDVEAELADKARPRGETASTSASNTDVRAPDEAEARPPRGKRFGVELGAGLLAGVDSVGPAILPVVRVGWRARPAWVLLATVSGLGTQPTLRTAAGTVRVAQSYALLGLCYCPTPVRLLSPYLALAAGASRVSLEGTAAAPARGHDVAQWSLLLDTGAGARLLLPGGFYATLSGHVQLAQPRVAIHVLDEQVGSTGRPSLVGNLLMGASL